MSKASEYLTNTHIMTDYPEGFCVYERAQRLWQVQHGESVLRLTLQADSPALVMNTAYARPYKSFTKREYQSVHNGSADETLRQEILTAFSTDIGRFRNELRTVGCGSNVYFQCADGVFQACVQRTAPAQTPEGIVQPGAYSRAAGGATGHLLETQTREMTEEMNVFIRQRDGSVVSADLFRTDRPVEERVQLAFFQEKEKTLDELYELIAHKVRSAVPSLTVATFAANAIHVDSLHEYVEEDIAGLKRTFRAVVADDPKNGDLSGVDCLLVVPMQEYHSSQILIADGERDQQGKLLGRTWFLAKPEFLASNQSAGTMKFSPVLAKTLQSTPKILEEISRYNP